LSSGSDSGNLLPPSPEAIDTLNRLNDNMFTALEFALTAPPGR
jgi:hypothetical protein